MSRRRISAAPNRAKRNNSWAFAAAFGQQEQQDDPLAAPIAILSFFCCWSFLSSRQWRRLFPRWLWGWRCVFFTCCCCFLLLTPIYCFWICLIVDSLVLEASRCFIAVIALVDTSGSWFFSWLLQLQVRAWPTIYSKLSKLSFSILFSLLFVFFSVFTMGSPWHGEEDVGDATSATQQSWW